MSREWGVTEWLSELLPTVVREAFSVLTQLGDAWFFFVVLAVLYWFGDRRRRWGFVIGATVGALALTLTLKGVFARPRPDEALRFAHASGYGFPSGHAIGSTVVWGLLALSIERARHRIRVAVATVVVALVGFSRLAIGVHFAVDVVVGLVVGLVYLAFVVEVVDWRPLPMFAVASVVAASAVVVTSLGGDPGTVAAPSIDSVAAFGGAVGALAAWHALDGRPEGNVGYVAAVVGLAVLGALSYVGLRWPLPLAAVFVINGVAQGGILAYPLVVGRVTR
ncbi:phosphatase PAP2 family protein [Halomicrococcus sp. SG-WS-1]|uniref:phosphatase PAP2 family protein n=1 Tax=Halomicrococcus sp. SG-WS-1 TaxID=3439057 RepID=UPI003F79303E